MYKYKSHAKVNIGLQIRDRRPDGYHNIHTIFQELEFHDLITLNQADTGCELTADVAWVPTDNSNICVEAYLALKARFPDLPGVRIQLEKLIPAGAGLGGGSGNGAAVLKGLNEMFALGISLSELEQIAIPIGADVPFFIRGGTQLGEEIGDQLTILPPLSAIWFLLVVPPFRINTAWAYSQVKKHLNSQVKRINFRGFFQGENTPWEFFENDFERIVIPAHPEIGVIKQQLITAGAIFASLSGSGSTVFGVFDDEAKSKQAESYFKKFHQTILTRPR